MRRNLNMYTAKINEIEKLLDSYQNIKVFKAAETRWIINYDKPNQRGEYLNVELSLNDCDWSASGLTNQWKKKGWIRPCQLKDTFISVETEVETAPASVFRLYNPQFDEHKSEINFGWILEANKINVEKILKEIEKRFYR